MIVTKEDLADLERIAKAVVDDFVVMKGNIDTQKDYADGIIAGISVKTSLVSGNYPDVRLIEATSAITLRLPGSDWYKAQEGNELRAIHRVTLGALAHEFTHTLQERADPESFNTALQLRKQFDPRTEKGPNEWLSGYYSIPQELESHALQAATEIWFGARDLDKEAFWDRLGTTEVYCRVAERIGSRDSNTDGVREWWTRVYEMAWMAYENWK